MAQHDGSPAQARPRAPDLGIRSGRFERGTWNAITDVPGVQVGQCTLDDAVAHTGVTAILPTAQPWHHPVFAGSHRLNGNGEVTGLQWIQESGLLGSPIALTNTHSLGVIRDGLVQYEVTQRADEKGQPFWSLPVVGETWDGLLNDINGFHLTADHARSALEACSTGAVQEGNVGGGTGMICHGFKGGIGTSSRVVTHNTGRTDNTDTADAGCTVAVLVQANHGQRRRFAVEGVPVGRMIDDGQVPLPQFSESPSLGSIIAVIATDAPLLPGQCTRLAQRAGLGVARTGGLGENGSGDLFVCFSTAQGATSASDTSSARFSTPVRTLHNDQIDPLFEAVVDATEEAILNAVLQARTMIGFRGTTVHQLPPDLLLRALQEYRWEAPTPQAGAVTGSDRTD